MEEDQQSGTLDVGVEHAESPHEAEETAADDVGVAAAEIVDEGGHAAYHDEDEGSEPAQKENADAEEGNDEKAEQEEEQPRSLPSVDAEGDIAEAAGSEREEDDAATATVTTVEDKEAEREAPAASQGGSPEEEEKEEEEKDCNIAGDGSKPEEEPQGESAGIEGAAAPPTRAAGVVVVGEEGKGDAAEPAATPAAVDDPMPSAAAAYQTGGTVNPNTTPRDHSRPLTSPANMTVIRDSVPTEEELLLAQMAVHEDGSHVLAAFRRGYDNSHVNRMHEGSYSRYLQSTRTVTEPQRLADSFYGTAPTIGTIPRNVASARASSAAPADRVQQQQQHRTYSDTDFTATTTSWHSGRNDTRVSDSRNNNSSRNSGYGGTLHGTARSATAAGRSIGLSSFGRTIDRDGASGNVNSTTMRSTFRSTARSTSTGGTMLRREVELLHDDAYNELVAQRDRRRHAFRRGKPENPKQQLDYVYYHHQSKGYYIPQEQPPDALLLQYNHLYDYGPDGTRMCGYSNEETEEEWLRQQQQQRCRLNPHAQPPRAFAETRGLSAKLRSGTFRSRMPTAQSSKAPLPHTEQTSSASSLRTARAVDVDALHCSQFRHTRSLEEVIASNPTTTQRSRAGLVAAIRSGRLNEDEVPPTLQSTPSQAKEATHEKLDGTEGGADQAAKAKNRQHHSVRFSADTYPDGRPTAADDSRDCLPRLPPQRGAAPTHRSGSASGKTYGVSRLHFTKRQDAELTPSAFVS